MKKAYWFVFVFLVWCAACALWYLYGVKGVLTSNQNNFDAPNRLVAIAEILFMLLGACLLGFAIAWLLKEEEISALEISTGQLQYENESLNRSREIVTNQLQGIKNAQHAETTSLKLKVSQLNHEKEELQKKLDEETESLQKIKVDNGEKKWLLDQKNLEADNLRNQVSELKTEKKNLEEANYQLKEEIKNLRSVPEEKTTVSHHPFVKPSNNERKDDLTKIKGIGPFIEKRLNMLGIYNFQQLSELDSEMVERVGAAIEFFPGRIARENWIGQARELFNKTVSD